MLVAGEVARRLQFVYNKDRYIVKERMGVHVHTGSVHA